MAERGEGVVPAVSVVVCAFTRVRAQQLLDAVDSLARQTRAPHEVIVVVDHNPPLLDWLLARASGIRALASRGSSGLAGARNTGLAAAGGQVVAFLDDDAVAAPDWVERLGAPYADPRVSGVGGAVLPAWEGRRPEWLPEEFLWVVGCSYRGLPLAPSSVRNFIGANMSFRRELLNGVGGFYDGLGRVATRPLGCEETELCIRLQRASPGGVLLYEPSARVHHRVPTERATWSYFVSRCLAEGASKAEVSRLAGRERGLASERTYVLRTLPAGLTGCAGVAGAARAAAILTGLAATTWGYLTGSIVRRRAGPPRPVGSGA